MVEYTDHLAETIKGDLSGLRVAVDCANGASSTTVERLMRLVECKAEIRFYEPDGVNINDNCGSTHLEQLKNRVRNGDFDLGVAFDGDAVLFSDEAEQIYQKEGLDAFVRHEVENAAKPLPQGPFAHFLQAIAQLQEEFKGREAPIITALVTARNAPAHERVVSTFRAWHVTVDQSFFLGGLSKQPILAAFRPHIFFDDQQVHGEAASAFVPSARVAYPKRES